MKVDICRIYPSRKGLSGLVCRGGGGERERERERVNRVSRNQFLLTSRDE